MSRGSEKRMNTIYSIGETAKIHGISKQTLIYYDKIDLLKPHSYDPNNNYRYYTMEEFATLDIILLLKEIGVPLAQIKDYLKNRNIVSSIALFKQQEQRLEKRIRILKHLQAKIKNKLIVFQDYEESAYEEDIVFIKDHPAYHVIEMEIKDPGGIPELEIAMKKLMQYMRDKNYIFNYQVGTTIQYERLMNRLFYENQTILTFVDKPLKDIHYKHINSATYVTIYFKGNYNSFHKPYEQLFRYINEHHYEIIGPSYELNITDLYSVHDNNEYITEIRIPIKKDRNI